MSDYNGWANWETWNAFNWLTNDESTARRCEDLSVELEVPQLAEALEEMLSAPVEDMPPSWHTDCVLQALTQVDWHELARGFAGKLSGI